MTTDAQLTEAARRLGVNNFLGVFASDTLPSLENIQPTAAGHCLIANYSPSTSGGTHWVGLLHLKSARHKPFYFDSYGFRPDYDDGILNVRSNFAAYLRDADATGFYPSGFKWNEFDVQALHDPQNDGTCGEWALFALVHGPPELDRTHAHLADEGGDIAPEKFAGEWARFEHTRPQPPSVRPSMLTAGQLWARPKNEAAARRNDEKVRRWAGIRPARPAI
jgi:hypothetical protein